MAFAASRVGKNEVQSKYFRTNKASKARTSSAWQRLSSAPPIRTFAASRVGKNEVLTAGLTNLDEHH